MTTNPDFDTVIVGGGIAGLVAAAFAAKGGRRVRVLEKSRELGGRARTTEAGGHLFNLGPHALYRGKSLERALHALDVPFSSHKVTTGGYLLDGQHRHSMVTGLVSLLSTGALSRAGKVQLGQFIARLRSIDTASLARTSVADYLERAFADASARRLVSALMRLTTYTEDPLRMSAQALVEQLAAGTFDGVGYPDAGWASLSAGLAEAARALGVGIETEVRVERIRREDARVIVSRKDAPSMTANNVVIAASPDLAHRLVGGAALAKAAAEARPVRAATLDVALSSLPDPQGTFALGIDEPTYFSVHSAFARLGPEGHAVLHCARYLGPDDALDANAVERNLELVLDRMQPGWRDLVIERRFLPRLVVANDTPSADRGGRAGRMDVDAAGVEGVWLAGDWVGPTDLLADASAASGRRAAERICERRAATQRAAAGRAAGA